MKSPKTTSILITLGFLLTLNAEDSGWCKRGRVFFPPLHPCSPPFYPFSHQVPSPLVLTGSLSHILGAPSPVSQLTQHTIRIYSLHPPLKYFLSSLFQKLPLRFFSLNWSLSSSQWTFLRSALACYFTKLGKAPTSWLWLVTDRLPRKTSGCGPREIALMFWQLYLRHAFFLICHLVTLQAFLTKHTGTSEKKKAKQDIFTDTLWECSFLNIL